MIGPNVYIYRLIYGALLGSFAALYVPAVQAQTFVSECAKAIRFNKSETQTNFASKLAVLDSIDLSNYEQIKSGGQIGVVIEGLPINASYDQFNERREELRKTFSLNQTLNYSQTHAWQAVSPESISGYIECLKATSKESMIVAVESVTKTVIQMHVIKREFAGQRNTDKLQILVIGAKLINETPILMKGGADEPLMFVREPGMDFSAIISLRNKEGTSIASKNVSIAKYSKIVQKFPSRSDLKMSRTSTCLAEKYPGRSDVTVSISAEPGTRLDPDTKQFDFSTADPGRCMVGSATPSWTSLTSKVVAMDVNCASSHAECTSTAISKFSVNQLTDIFEEEK